MSRSTRIALRRRGRALLAATAAAALATAALPTTPTASAADPDPGCPAAYPVADLQAGDPVHGLTVSSGTEPDTFTGEYVDVIGDGIAPGLDMIIVKLSGSVITDETGKPNRGIWAGMSGSPVYAADGRLIGAVSYGLSATPSEFAGVTPAAAMYRLGRYEGLTLDGTETVQPTAGEVTQLRSFGVPLQQARAGFSRLAMPTSVSGLTGRLPRVVDRLGLQGLAPSNGFAATATDEAGAIVPGGNVAMAMSYGDVTASAVGTVTAVCDDAVLAFGHPFSLTGKATASLHAARALYIQQDTVFGSFKVANPLAPVGVFTQDRLAGILGRLGPAPATTPITSTVASSEGNRHTGSTNVTDPAMTADVATMHLLSNLDSVYDGYRGGTAALAWAITVRRPDGRLATLNRRDVYASAGDLTWSMPWDFHLDLRRVMNNRFEDVEVVKVEQRAWLSTKLRQLRLGAVEIRRDGRWSAAGRRSFVFARPGEVLRVRAWLEPAAGSTVSRRQVYFATRIPRTARGMGTFALTGGQSGWGSAASGATTLPGMLGQLATAPGNDTVTAELRIRTQGGLHRVQRHVDKPAPVVGAKYFTVVVPVR